MANHEQKQLANAIDIFWDDNPKCHVEPDNVHVLDFRLEEYIERRIDIAMYGDTVNTMFYGSSQLEHFYPRNLEREVEQVDHMNSLWMEAGLEPMAEVLPLLGRVSREQAEQGVRERHAMVLARETYDQSSKMGKAIYIAKFVMGLKNRRAFSIMARPHFPYVVHDTVPEETYALVNQESTSDFIYQTQWMKNRKQA